MPLLPKLAFRRTLIALGALAILGTLVAEPAAADHGRRWRSRGPRVGVFVGVPPIVLVAGRPSRYYDPYEDRYDERRYDERRYDGRERAYDRGYEDGYDDGYDDSAREEWRRRRAYSYRRHHDCD